MSKKLYAAFLALLLALLVVAAFVVLPMADQAEASHWYSCQAKAGGKYRDSKCSKAAAAGNYEWRIIPANGFVTLKARGTWTTRMPGVSTTCKVNNRSIIKNPLLDKAGLGIITAFAVTECVATPAQACRDPGMTALRGGRDLSLANAWPSKLEKVAGVMRDKITGIQVGVRCGGVKTGLFVGALTPKIASSVLEFGTGSGELKDPAKGKATVTGSEDLEGPAGDVGVTAKTP